MSAHERVIAALERCNSTSNGRDMWHCPVPDHEDNTPSLWVTDKSDTVTLWCFGGCSTDRVLDALDLDWPDLYDEPRKHWRTSTLRSAGASIGKDGRVRLGNTQYAPGGTRKKTEADAGSKRELWPDPATVEGPLLFVVEGEPDAMTAKDIGLPAVAIPGVGKWDDAWAERIARGRERVVVIPDCDGPGRARAQACALAVAGRCSDVRFLDLGPDRSDGYDLGEFALDARSDADRAVARDAISQAAENAKRIAALDDEPQNREVPPIPRRAFVNGDEFVLDAPKDVPALWGSGEDVLWAQGEALLIAAPQGAGKSTLAQQIAFARIGALPPELLGYPIQPDDRPVVYIAADRPQQIRRSMARMLGEDERGALGARLRVWPGPLPFTLTDDPSRLAAWLLEQNAGTVVIDSLKDIAIGLSEDAVGAAINQARQHVLAAGIDVVELHHQRKGQEGRKPRALADVYGSTWITAGTGSVVLLWGEAGDSYVELTHLKQPAADVGPFTIHHNHARGRTTLHEAVDLLDLASKGVTVTEAAQATYDASTPSRNQRECVRNRLERLAKAGRVEREKPQEVGGSVTYWLPGVAPRCPERCPPQPTSNGGQRLAETEGNRGGNGGQHPLAPL